nr:terminase small subunit [Klebsiella phage vB_Kpn_K50PH164C1]
MSEEKKKPHEAYNFKRLYNKRYGDIVTLNHSHRYTPEQVFDMAIRYFEWAEENALKSAETSSFQGRTYQDAINKPRIFTLNGLRLFNSWSKCALEKWRKEPGFKEVMEFIDTVIYEQKYQLAANGVVSANFIGKDLGLDNAPQINVSATAENTSIDAVKAEEVKEAVIDILEKI